MTPEDVIDVAITVRSLWPARLCDQIEAEQAVIIAATFPDLELRDVMRAVQLHARRSSPFPPSWPEIAALVQSHRHGVTTDPEVIVGVWLGEVEQHVRHRGAWAEPRWSDVIIGVAIQQAAGSWQAWCATPTGGEAANGAYTRNLAPERDDRFRRACRAMLRHRAETGEQLPAIARRRRELAP